MSIFWFPLLIPLSCSYHPPIIASRPLRRSGLFSHLASSPRKSLQDLEAQIEKSSLAHRAGSSWRTEPSRASPVRSHPPSWCGVGFTLLRRLVEQASRRSPDPQFQESAGPIMSPHVPFSVFHLPPDLKNTPTLPSADSRSRAASAIAAQPEKSAMPPADEVSLVPPSHLIFVPFGSARG